MENLDERSLQDYWFNLLWFLGLISARFIVVFPGASTCSYCVIIQAGFPRRYRHIKFDSFAKRRVREESNSTIACYRISKDGRQIIFFALNAGQPSQRAMRDLAKHRVPEWHYLGPDFFAAGNKVQHPAERHLPNEAPQPVDDSMTLDYHGAAPNNNNNNNLLGDPAEESTDGNHAQAGHVPESEQVLRHIPDLDAQGLYDQHVIQADIVAMTRQAAPNNNNQPTSGDPAEEPTDVTSPACGPNNNNNNNAQSSPQSPRDSDYRNDFPRINPEDYNWRKCDNSDPILEVKSDVDIMTELTEGLYLDLDLGVNDIDAPQQIHQHAQNNTNNALTSLDPTEEDMFYMSDI